MQKKLRKNIIRICILMTVTAVLLSNGCSAGKEPQKAADTDGQDSTAAVTAEKTKRKYQKQYVKKGDKVTVVYVGTLRDGSVFHKAGREDPFIFIVGDPRVMRGFSNAVIGMKLHGKKRFIIPPEGAYGNRNEYLIKKFAREEIPPDPEPEKGKVITMYGLNGRKMPATIIDVTDKAVMLDLNHPLAGKTLIYDAEIIDIE